MCCKPALRPCPCSLSPHLLQDLAPSFIPLCSPSLLLLLPRRRIISTQVSFIPSALLYWSRVVLAPKADLASTSVVTLPSMAAFHFLDHSSTQNSVPLAWLLSPSLFLCLILLSLRLFSLTHLRSSFPILPLTCWYSLVFPAQSTGPLIPLAFPRDLMCTVVRLPSTCHNSLMCVSTLDLSPEAQIHVITWLLDS